jgi:hypothetical protein
MGMIWTRFHAWIMSLAGVVASGLAIYAYGRKRGSDDTQIEHERANIKKSREIEDAADRARRADGDNLPAVERLRRASRLRDL